MKIVKIVSISRFDLNLIFLTMYFINYIAIIDINDSYSDCQHNEHVMTESIVMRAIVWFDSMEVTVK